MFDVVLTSGFVIASFAYPDQAEEYLKRNYSGAGKVVPAPDLRAQLEKATEVASPTWTAGYIKGVADTEAKLAEQDRLIKSACADIALMDEQRKGEIHMRIKAGRERDAAQDALKSLALELAADHGAALKTLIDERDAAQAEVQTLELVIAHVQRSLVKAMPKRALIQHLDDPERLSYYVDKLVEMKDADLAVNAALLAKQTDLAREAETREVQAQAEAAALRRELQRIAVYGIVTEQRMDKPSESEHEQLRQVRKIAAAALVTPSTAGERPVTKELVEKLEQELNNFDAKYKAMERVCHVAEDNRRIEYPRELIEALDELAALEKD